MMATPYHVGAGNGELLLQDERLQQAVSLFNCHDWYGAHDAFEEIWHESLGSDREVLQGIIQISVAEHHLNNGNQRGSILLMAEGLNHIQACLGHGVGFDLHLLAATVSQRLLALQAGKVVDHLPLPVLKQRHLGQD
jgi:predicted metal-dependent hydrolase